MRVYLMRHGEASTGPSGEPELTPRGIDEVSSVADWCASQELGLDRILHSSKRRARQTAEITYARVHSRHEPEEHAGLKPDDDPFVVATMLESAEAPLLIVSHLPILDCVAGLLVENDPRRIVVGFATAQVAGFERREGEWRMVWTRKGGSGGT